MMKLLLRTLLIATALAPGAAWAATLTFPGAAPCDTTLQACITGAVSGDVIEIATNSPIDENLTINKSLTLRPAAGFTPTIGGGITHRTVGFGGLGASAVAETLVVEGITFELTGVRGLVSQASGHSITIRDNVFHFELDNNNTPSIEIDARVPLTGVIAGNRITSTGQGIRLWAILPSGTVDYTIERNWIDTSLPAQSNAGIYFDLRGSGSYNVRAFSNVLFGVGGCNCGGNAGIRMDVISDPVVVASISNNTVHDTQTATGIDLLVRDAGSNVTFQLFNNIVSLSDRSGIRLGNLNGATITLAADQNVSIGNANPDEFLGLPAGNVLAINPQYLDALNGDLHLQTYSPLINAGVDAPPGGNSMFDADGAPRILGPQIDIGAYEQAERTEAPLPIPALGPAGIALLSTLLLLAGIGLVARRARAQG